MPVNREIQILVVDDQRHMRDMIRNCLFQNEFKNVEFAKDGISALQKIQHTSYDLILVDLHMDHMNGMELLKEIRSSQVDTICGLPILIVTAETGREQLIQALRIGANDYLIKPFQADYLVKKIEELFEELSDSQNHF